MRLALDSSFIAKLVIEEDLSDEADELIRTGRERFAEFIASELALHEVTNVLTKYMKKTGTDGRPLLQSVTELGIIFIPADRGLLEDAMEIANVNNISLYDGVHIALSRRKMVTLVTEDRELRRKFENTGTIREVLSFLQE